MRRTTYDILWSGIAGLFLAACNPADDVTDGQSWSESVPLAVHTRVVADNGLTSGPSGRLLFWSDEVFHEKWMKGSTDAYPRYSVLLDKEINHYTYKRQIYYETPYSYPLDFGKIHATGYAPDNVLSPVENKGYTELKVGADYRDGSVDLLTCDGSFAHSGSMNPDNTFLEEEKELDFRHLTAKLTFLGLRESEMVGLMGVRNIRITINEPGDDNGKLVVPATLNLYTGSIAFGNGDVETDKDKQDDYSTYVVSETTPYPYDRELVHSPIIPPDETVVLGTCFVLSDGIGYGTQGEVFDPIKGEWAGTQLTGNPQLGITVKAELYDARPGNTSELVIEETWQLDKIDTWSTHTGDKFLPGYEYKITIRFNRTGIALRAEAVPWNSEQLHEYPIHPGKHIDNSQN